MRFANQIEGLADLIDAINLQKYEQAMLPGGLHGPAQGPNIPIKRYGDKYFPDATQPTGYRPGPTADASSMFRLDPELEDAMAREKLFVDTGVMN